MKFHKQAFILLLFVIFWLCPVAAKALEVGTAAPDFKLRDLQGREVRLADYKGRLVLLKLATTWCPTCKQLSAEIEKASAFLKEQDVVFLEVFVQDSNEMVEKYLGDTQYPMTFHALLDDGQVYKAYNVYLIPRLLVVDAAQVVRFDSGGRNVLAEDILSMVGEFGTRALPGGNS